VSWVRTDLWIAHKRLPAHSTISALFSFQYSNPAYHFREIRCGQPAKGFGRDL